MLDLGKRGISPTVVGDQIGRLTFTTELAKTIDHLLTSDAPFGTYNATNGGTPASWAEITRKIFETALLDATVTDTSTADYYQNKPEAAPRPLNSVMDLRKLKATGYTIRDWQENLTEYIQKELPQ